MAQCCLRDEELRISDPDTVWDELWARQICPQYENAGDEQESMLLSKGWAAWPKCFVS